MGTYPSCLKSNEGTVISIRSKCFTKPIKIVINDTDDKDAIKRIEEVLNVIQDKIKQQDQTRRQLPATPRV